MFMLAKHLLLKPVPDSPWFNQGQKLVVAC